MLTDKLLEFIVNSVRTEEREAQRRKDELLEMTRWTTPAAFTVEVPAGDLVRPCRAKAARHREREKHWTEALEAAEKELREKGVDVKVWDPSAGYDLTMTNMIASGSIGGAGAGAVQFKAELDPKLVGAARRAKDKMLEHRGKADRYEKEARAFSLAPSRPVRLSVEEVTYFGLGE